MSFRGVVVVDALDEYEQVRFSEDLLRRRHEGFCDHLDRVLVREDRKAGKRGTRAEQDETEHEGGPPQPNAANAASRRPRSVTVTDPSAYPTSIDSRTDVCP